MSINYLVDNSRYFRVKSILLGCHLDSLNQTERMKIRECGCSYLPDMKEIGHDFSVYVSESKIYLIGGLKYINRVL
jgi:hypothetical protein